jgi:hypothetical protein
VPLAQLSPLSYEISSTITYYCCQVISANRSLENRPVVFDEELRGRLLLISAVTIDRCCPAFVLRPPVGRRAGMSSAVHHVRPRRRKL